MGLPKQKAQHKGQLTMYNKYKGTSTLDTNSGGGRLHGQRGKA